jgi:predicted nuclease with TOPRIM domain
MPYAPISYEQLKKENSKLSGEYDEVKKSLESFNRLQPETSRLQRELDNSVSEIRDLKDKLHRAEEETERQRSKNDSKIRELESERLRLEEQVHILSILCACHF